MNVPSSEQPPPPTVACRGASCLPHIRHHPVCRLPVEVSVWSSLSPGVRSESRRNSGSNRSLGSQMHKPRGAAWSLGSRERQHVSLVHAQKQGSEARLPGERAWQLGTNPLTLAGAPCLNFPLCKAEMMLVPAAQGSLLYLQQRGRLCHQADAISLVWPVSAGHGALSGGSCPQGVGSPLSSPHYPQGPPLFPMNCH